MRVRATPLLAEEIDPTQNNVTDTAFRVVVVTADSTVKATGWETKRKCTGRVPTRHDTTPQHSAHPPHHHTAAHSFQEHRHQNEAPPE